MAATSQEVVSLSPEVATAARDFAQRRNCSIDELASEAIRSYLGQDLKLAPEVNEHRRRALDLGLTLDEYAVRLVKETRAKMRVEKDQASA